MSEQNQNRNNRSRNQNGRNRNSGGGNQNRNQSGGGGNRRSGGPNKRGGSEASQKRNELQPSRRRSKPEPLTFWQKIKKAFGLYKEPTSKQPSKAAKKTSPQKSGRVAGGGRVDNRGGNNKPKGNQRNRNASGSGGSREDQNTPPTEVKSPRLYVGNLSYDASEYDLEELFKGIGSIRSVELVYNHHTHKSKGYGFITMANVEEAERAVEVLHDQPFMGRKMIVNGARSTGANDGSSSGGERPRRAKKKGAPRKSPADEIPAEEEVHSLAPKED